MTATPLPSAATATAALREVAYRIFRSSDPAEVADLVEEITRDDGTLEALSSALAAAGRWAKDRPSGGHLWQPLSRASDEIWEAGTDIAELPAQLRALPATATRVRSAAARNRVGSAVVPSPPTPSPASVAAAVGSQTRRDVPAR
ncbi:hypothetical protein ACFVVU_30650 [Kitasatospora sp. NPDC057965]|uniref:hypothetical protein n=1 Tax=Kitasatospora sp. NPDC057965 TaxID=3346291 RepID=UPI0036D93C81